MRVVAGSARGRPLIAPPGSRTRPTPDRVREAVFNALYSMYDAVAGARVLDLFAGSGALGIEALSRGAAAATFVESDRAAVEAIRQNLRTTGFGGLARVVRADAMSWLASSSEPHDLAFCDPPYAFDAWKALLEAMPAPLAVLESGGPLDLPEDWHVLRCRRYGGTVVTIVRRREAGVTPRENVS